MASPSTTNTARDRVDVAVENSNGELVIDLLEGLSPEFVRDILNSIASQSLKAYFDSGRDYWEVQHIEFVNRNRLGIDAYRAGLISLDQVEAYSEAQALAAELDKVAACPCPSMRNASL